MQVEKVAKTNFNPRENRRKKIENKSEPYTNNPKCTENKRAEVCVCVGGGGGGGRELKAIPFQCFTPTTLFWYY